MLLDHIGQDRIACVVLASIRPRPEELIAPLLANGVAVLTQPRRSSSGYPAFAQAFADASPDLLLCNSYSMKLGADLLAVVGGNAINLHAALLPRNRGPNPIQWAIIHGDRTTGVSLHYMIDDIDAGDIVAQHPVSIADDDTWLTVRDKAHAAMRAILAAEVPRILAGTNDRVSQDHRRATLNTRLTPDSPRIDFATMTDDDIYNLVRAQVRPLAGAYLELADGERRRFPDMLTRNDIARLRARYA